jgi:hypothetical protein
MLPIQCNGLDLRDLVGSQPLIDLCGTPQNFVRTERKGGIDADLHFRFIGQPERFQWL